MTEVEFHTGVADKIGFTCRLLRKAVSRDAKVVVHGEPPLLDRLDQMLWTFDPLAFVPHARARRVAVNQRLVPHTPVWLADEPDAAPHHQVLVNLAAEPPQGFETFTRLIEVVGQEPEDVSAGRTRWKHYVARGYSIKHHTGVGG